MKTHRILRGMPEYYEAIGAKRGPHDVIRYVMLNLPASCALACEKCARSDAREQAVFDQTPPLTLAEQVRFLDLAREIGAKELVIIGDGEPTQFNNWPQFYRPIIEHAHAKGMGTILFTTGFFLTRPQAEFCRDHNFTVIISLDTLDDDKYRDMYGIARWGVKAPAQHVRNKIAILAEIFAGTERLLSDGRIVTRLGIDATIQRKNEMELGALREFAHRHGLYFIANTLMPEGRAARYQNWPELVGSDEVLARHKALAAAMSDSGAHSSSVQGGRCNYWADGIASSANGFLQGCGYASDTAHPAENVRDIKTADELRWFVRRNRAAYDGWCESIGRDPSCPLRDEDYGGFVVVWLNKNRR